MNPPDAPTHGPAPAPEVRPGEGTEGRRPRPRTSAGRAESFRRQQRERRSARRELTENLIVVGIILVGVIAIVTAKPGALPDSYVPPPPTPTITVHLGTPTVSSIVCGNGASASAERIPWVSTTTAVTTGDVSLRVYEIWDGDYYGDPGAVAVATPTNVCAGAPPSASARWYAVFEAPNGTNVLTYTQSEPWAPVSGGAWNFVVENASVLVLVANPSLAGSGRGLAVFGFAGGSPVIGAVAL